jgi:catechol 2,3-dioxygenase-like lactoylglutathione lyase family enzyme
MLPIRGLYEVAIRVKDLEKSEAFYREALGFAVGLRDERRRWLFLRAGGDAGMVVLQEDAALPSPQHLAFTVEKADLEAAAEALRRHGTVNFYGNGGATRRMPRRRIPTPASPARGNGQELSSATRGTS